VLGPSGNGGWSGERRSQEIDHARQMSRAVLASTEANTAAQAETPVSSATESVATAPVARTLDLGAALDLASRNNRGIAIAQENVAEAAGNVAIARSALLPTPSVQAVYDWYSDKETNSIKLDPSLFPPGTTLPVVTVRQQEFATVNAAVSLAIDISGQLMHVLESSQASYRAESARAWATRLQEERDVVAAYFGLLEAKSLLEVNLQTVSLHERQLADAQNRFDQGRLTRNEVLVVDVALANSRQNSLRLANVVSSARRDLNRVTGLEIGDDTDARDVASRPGLPTLDGALAAARAKNPLVTSLVEEVQAADERLTAARRARLPQFGATGGYSTTTADTLHPRDYGAVGVTMNVDLYSFRREGEIARLDSESHRSRLLLDRLVRDIEAMVRDSHDRVRERLSAIDTARVATDQADENLRIRQVQFREGRATSEDLLDAAELAARQRAQLASALYEAHERRAELQQLMGEPLGNLLAEGSVPAAASRPPALAAPGTTSAAPAPPPSSTSPAPFVEPPVPSTEPSRTSQGDSER
jgi:outer membrane protein TolC